MNDIGTKGPRGIHRRTVARAEQHDVDANNGADRHGKESTGNALVRNRQNDHNHHGDGQNQLDSKGLIVRHPVGKIGDVGAHPRHRPQSGPGESRLELMV